MGSPKVIFTYCHYSLMITGCPDQRENSIAVLVKSCRLCASHILLTLPHIVNNLITVHSVHSFSQRFFRHMCMSAKVPAVVRLAKEALAEEKCVVIGLQSTGEARTEEAIAKYVCYLLIIFYPSCVFYSSTGKLMLQNFVSQ